MKFTLTVLAGQQLERLGRSLSSNPPARERMTRHLWEELKTSLRAANGPPPGSVPCPEYGPDCWWVHFPPCYLALVRFRTTRRLFGWLVRRTAEVVALNFSPGLPGRGG
jgi:hypothetical protein